MGRCVNVGCGAVCGGGGRFAMKLRQGVDGGDGGGIQPAEGTASARGRVRRFGLAKKRARFGPPPKKGATCQAKVLAAMRGVRWCCCG